MASNGAPVEPLPGTLAGYESLEKLLEVGRRSGSGHPARAAASGSWVPYPARGQWSPSWLPAVALPRPSHDDLRSSSCTNS